MLNLTIQHMIHLTREQRYAVHEGIELVVQGISIPIWFMDKVTSEPAKEVFCRYYLKNLKGDIPVQIKNDGFEISLPFRPGKKMDLTDEQWRELNLRNPEKLELMYKNTPSEVSSINLLDLKDGVSGRLMYREHNKLKQNDKLLNVMHFIQIGDMQTLLDSL